MNKIITLLSLLAIITSWQAGRVCSQENTKNRIILNEHAVKGWYSEPDTEDPIAVFRYIFMNLENEIYVFPTENYYYFRFFADGKTFWGSMSLSAHNRDENNLSFGYIEKSDDFMGEDWNAVGGSKEFTKEDGLIIKKIDPFNYSVKFQEKKVIFHLNRLSTKMPSKAKIAEDEVLVGPAFDESGLQFFLIFNNSGKHMYWILNEENYVPESFDRENDYLVFGRRTGFAFFSDTINNRKILVGVDGNNVLKNNWYDGPFDQMPDNHVNTGEIEVRKYIEAAYPADSGKIDKFGNYLDEEGVRIAIAPYYAYYSKQSLIDQLESCIKESKSKSELYCCITEQIFYWPD